MKKLTLTTIAAGVTAALTVGLAAPVSASTVEPRDAQDTVTKVEAPTDNPQLGENHYDTYQNKNKRQSVHKR